jgi:hypothetical protein
MNISPAIGHSKCEVIKNSKVKYLLAESNFTEGCVRLTPFLRTSQPLCLVLHILYIFIHYIFYTLHILYIIYFYTLHILCIYIFIHYIFL